ncbi:MAG: TetR/AcrR family transcriptional regulator [Cellulosilyticaceae bacterium]
MKQTDLRIQKTYTALTTAFLQLLEKKQFEEISVKELCDLALIRRATFYKHFADKYEFAIFVIRQLQAQFYADNSIPDTEARPKSFYFNMLRRAVSFISQNEQLLHSILHSNMSSPLMDILSEEISSTLQLQFEEDLQNGAKLPSSPEILAQFFTGALTQTLRYWLMQKDRLSEDELVEQLLNLLNMF